MMILYLVRHGIAVDRDDPDCPPDPERPLTPAGIKKCRAAARGFRALNIKPDLVLSSPWLRAVQTADIFCEEIGYSVKDIVRNNALKGTSNPAELFSELAKIKATKRVACFGHEPHLHLAIGYLLHMKDARVAELKKAGMACLQLDRLSPPQGRLLSFYPAKALRLLESSLNSLMRINFPFIASISTLAGIIGRRMRFSAIFSADFLRLAKAPNSLPRSHSTLL